MYVLHGMHGLATFLSYRRFGCDRWIERLDASIAACRLVALVDLIRLVIYVRSLLDKFP